MDSKSIDEILCTNCGRPNLPEAVKCWYCQIPLEKDTETQKPVEEKVQNPADSSQPDQTQNQTVEEDIPDWLKRIRELKREDHIDDDIEDEWQQQVLFNGSSPEAQANDTAEKVEKKTQPNPKPAASIHQQPEKTSKPASPAPQPALDIQQTLEEKTEKPVLSQKEDHLESQAEDLPEGFVKFNPKSN